LLAARIIKDQGIDVVGVHFKIPFCKIDVKKITGAAVMEILEFDLGDDFLALLGNPRYGYGSNMNPCIDCKILMFAKARELLGSLNADFVVTGEVLGQRPMSQNRQSLRLIGQKSGLNDLLLRPLSAQFFEPSLPEREGWVKREKLLAFSGRMRTPQMELAKKLGIDTYPTPAGGCLLTDPCFSKRLGDLLCHGELDMENLALLNLGRHFRMGEKSKLVVGRDKRENEALTEIAKPGDYLFAPQEDLAGPVSLARGQLTDELVSLSSQITCAYSDTCGLKEINVSCRRLPESRNIMHKVECFHKDRFVRLLV